MKKKIIGSVLVLGIVAAAAGLFVPNAVQKITKESVITSSQLEKAVDISELSTAEFIYNGIADKYSDGNLEETECHIAYAALHAPPSPVRGPTTLISPFKISINCGNSSILVFLINFPTGVILSSSSFAGIDLPPLFPHLRSCCGIYKWKIPSHPLYSVPDKKIQGRRHAF